MDFIKQKYIQALIDSKAILIRSIEEEPFTLRSGRKSYVYVNHSLMANSSKFYIAFIDAIKELLLKEYGTQEFILCNVDSKISAQMVGSLAYILKKPQIIFKSEQLTALEKGPGQQLTGNSNWNLPVAIVDDVLTLGGTVKNVADLLTKQFSTSGKIQLFVGLARSPQIATETLQKSDVRAKWITTLDEVILKLFNTLKEEQQKALLREMPYLSKIIKY